MRTNQFQMRVHWGDTDAAGIVFYPNYFKWFDIASHHFFRTIGYPIPRLAKEMNVVTPLLEVKCNFEHPLVNEDIITIRTTVDELKTKTFKFIHEVYRGDERAGHGYEVRAWVLQENNGMKAAPIPEEIRALLEADEITESRELP